MSSAINLRLGGMYEGGTNEDLTIGGYVPNIANEVYHETMAMNFNNVHDYHYLNLDGNCIVDTVGDFCSRIRAVLLETRQADPKDANGQSIDLSVQIEELDHLAVAMENVKKVVDRLVNLAAEDGRLWTRCKVEININNAREPLNDTIHAINHRKGEIQEALKIRQGIDRENAKTLQGIVDDTPVLHSQLPSVIIGIIGQYM